MFRRKESNMKKTTLWVALFGLMLGGCGVKQDYVDAQINDAEARMNAKVDAVTNKTEMNAQEIAQLQSLSKELSGKADMAINKASGFENYQILWEGQINFAFDSWDIDDVAGQILAEAGQKMEQVRGSVIEIAGHADQTGSKKYNYLIAQHRAEAAKRYLAESFGISLYRMFEVSFGEDKPVAMPDERSASSKNRRVSLTIWGAPGQ
jgi:peptidoglycan-associated lipoprotein